MAYNDCPLWGIYVNIILCSSSTAIWNIYSN